MGSPPSISGPEFEKMAYRRKHPEIVVGAVADFCARYTKEELYEEGQKRRIAVTPINTAGEFVEMEQTKARGLFVDMEHRYSSNINNSAGAAAEETPAHRRPRRYWLA